MTTVPATDMAGVFGRLKSLFNFNGFLKPQVSGIVTPTVNALELGGRDTGFSKQINLSGTLGSFCELATVPKGQRWVIIITKKYTSTAAAGPQIKLGGVWLGLGAATTADQIWDGYDIELSAGDQIGFGASGNAGDTAIDCSVIYRKYFISD